MDGSLFRAAAALAISLCGLGARAAEHEAATPPGESVTAHALAGEARAYAPYEVASFLGARLVAPLRLGVRTEATSAYPVDEARTRLGEQLLTSPLARVALRLENLELGAGMKLQAEYEHDLPTGTLGVDGLPAGAGLPGDAPLTLTLRKASARLSFGQLLHVGGGVTTSHFGLGLVANDGAHGWEPGSARFSDPRGGDRTLRFFLASGAFGPLGLRGSVAYDRILDDDALLTAAELDAAEGDTADQIALAVLAGNEESGGGLSAARRSQESTDGRTLTVIVLDATARHQVQAGGARVALAAELAYVFGDTTLSATPEIPEQDVRQLGAALQGRVDFGAAGGALDVLYASGDQNLDDATQNGFRVDVNYEMGLLLYRHVLAGHSGRAAGTAGDPSLVGAPAPGLERFPTRGAATNTVAFFPRASWRPLAGLETYAGPLFALSEVRLVDPLNTRVAGGAPRNALGGTAGSYLGTELDGGVRYRALLWGTEVTVGAEAGVLWPGSALQKADGTLPKAVYGGRFMIDYRI